MSVNLLGDLLLAVPLYADLSLILLLVLAFRKGANRAWRIARFLLIPVLIGTLLAGSASFSNAWMWRLEHRYPVPAITDADRHPDNLILVLSAGWARETERGPELERGEDGWERTHAGVALWKKVGGQLRFVGGPLPGSPGVSEGGAMAALAREFGVPDAAITVEPDSRNTYENLTHSLSVLRAHTGHTWLVTSALHLPRAMAIATHLGVTPIPYPGFFHAQYRLPWRHWLPSNQGPSNLDDVLHEELGMIVYRHRGWVD